MTYGRGGGRGQQQQAGEWGKASHHCSMQYLLTSTVNFQNMAKSFQCLTAFLWQPISLLRSKTLSIWWNSKVVFLSQVDCSNENKDDEEARAPHCRHLRQDDSPPIPPVKKKKSSALAVSLLSQFQRKKEWCWSCIPGSHFWVFWVKRLLCTTDTTGGQRRRRRRQRRRTLGQERKSPSCLSGEGGGEWLAINLFGTFSNYYLRSCRRLDQNFWAPLVRRVAGCSCTSFSALADSWHLGWVAQSDMTTKESVPKWPSRSMLLTAKQCLPSTYPTRYTLTTLWPN